MEQIRLGLEKGLDMSMYAKSELDDLQMNQLCLDEDEDEGIDIMAYIKTEFNAEQLEQIRYGLEKDLDVSIYAKLEFNAKQMEQIRVGLEKEKSQNVSEYAESEKDTSVEPEETASMSLF